MEFQVETEFLEVKSPIDRFKQQWEHQPGALPFLKQRNVILQNPDLIQYAELARVKGWAQPLIFALQGLMVVAVIVSALNWWTTRERGAQADAIAAIQADLDQEMKRQQGVMEMAEFALERTKRSHSAGGFAVVASTGLTKEEAVEKLNALMEETRRSQQQYRARAEARMKNLHAEGDALALAGAGTPVVFSLALLFAAQVFRKGLQADYGGSKLSRQADDHYLYYMVSRGLWINCVFVVVLNVVLRGNAYGLSGFFAAVGPIGGAIFWLLLYGLLLYWFLVVSKDLYKSMQIQRPANFMGLENKILLRLHNSFWIVFLVFELGLLALSYGVYLLEKSVG